MKTRKLALNAVLAAMCAALGALALDLNSIKITFESFPILLGALLFGPLDGLAVGFVGTLLYQLLRYGVSATTLLWILPYALAGLVTGFYAKRRGFSLTTGQTVGIVVARPRCSSRRSTRSSCTSTQSSTATGFRASSRPCCCRAARCAL